MGDWVSGKVDDAWMDGCMDYGYVDLCVIRWLRGGCVG